MRLISNTKYKNEHVTEAAFQKQSIAITLFNIILQRIFNSMAPLMKNPCAKIVSQSRSIILWKHLVHYEKKNMTKEAPGCWAAKILYQANMGKNFSVRTTTASQYFFSLKYRPSLQVIADHCWKRACKKQKNKCSFLSDPKPDHQIENGNRQLTTGVSKW